MYQNVHIVSCNLCLHATASDFVYSALRMATNITLQINFEMNCKKNNNPKMMSGQIIDKLPFYRLTIAKNVP